MPTNTSSKDLRAVAPQASLESEAGFTLFEMVVAMMLLTIGLLGLAAVFSYAVAASGASRNVTSAKMMMGAMREQIESMRNEGDLTYGQIVNVGQPIDANGAKQVFNGFPTNFLPITEDPGADGIYGTTDDPATTVKPENKAYSRRVLITPLSAFLKRIEITVRYPANNGTIQQIVGVSYLNNDARGTYRR